MHDHYELGGPYIYKRSPAPLIINNKYGDGGPHIRMGLIWGRGPVVPKIGGPHNNYVTPGLDFNFLRSN